MRPTPGPNRLRWDPLPYPERPADFVEGLATIGTNGDASGRDGIGVHIYRATSPMTDRVFSDTDGELLIVPRDGRLRLRTEFGVIDAAPGEIALIPRGVKFRVALPDGGRAAMSAELRRAVPSARTRPDRRQRSREPARFPPPPRRVRGAQARPVDRRQVRRSSVGDRVRPFAARCCRVARQLCAVQIRSRAVQHDRHGQLRPSGPVDLHGADLADRDAGHRELRFRDLSAALDGRRAHLPPAILPSQLYERVHGPRARRL